MTRKRLGFTALVMAWGLGCFTSIAHAQATDSLEAAKRAYLEGRFEDSVRELEPLLTTLTEAADLRDAHFFLGLNYLALGRNDDANAQFGSAVKQDPDFVPPSSLYSPDIVAAYEDARRGLAGRIHIESDPPGARVSLAGKAMGRAPVDSTVLAGQYMIRAELDEHTPVERAIQVRAGEETQVRLTLRALTIPAPVETPEEPEPSPPTAQAPTRGGGVSGKTIGIIAGVGGGAALAIAAAGGGSDSGTSGSGPGTPSTPPPTASRANITAAIAPNPIIVQASGERDFPWRVEFEVTVRETAGLGGNIDFINTIIRDAATGTESNAVNLGAGEIIARVGTNHVDARGNLTVPLAIRYRLSSGMRQAIIIAEVRFTDDRGNVLNATAQANAQ